MASGSSLPLEQAKTPRSEMDIAQATPADGPRILFLDDDPYRARAFLGRHPDAVWVETAGDCITRLAEPWDEVHLDHDLGGEIYVDSSRKDRGMEVVRWLCSQPVTPSATLFFVHSHNADAASAMVQACGTVTRRSIDLSESTCSRGWSPKRRNCPICRLRNQPHMPLTCRQPVTSLAGWPGSCEASPD